MISFDADIALEPIAEGRWRGHVPASWWIGAGPNGGFMAALAARATELVSAHPLASMTVHYLDRPVEGPIEVSARVTRTGRSAAFIRIWMEQEGRLVVQAGAVCHTWREDTPAWDDTVAPKLPGPDDCVRIDPERSNVQPLMRNYDMRVASADPAARPNMVTGWIRTAEPRHVDRPLLAAYSDAFIPPSLVRVGFNAYVPTLELTIHFRGLPPEGDYPWVKAQFTTRVAAGGTIEEDGELWSADGKLLVMSRQLAIIRSR